MPLYLTTGLPEILFKGVSRFFTEQLEVASLLGVGDILATYIE